MTGLVRRLLAVLVDGMRLGLIGAGAPRPGTVVTETPDQLGYRLPPAQAQAAAGPAALAEREWGISRGVAEAEAWARTLVCIRSLPETEVRR